MRIIRKISPVILFIIVFIISSFNAMAAETDIFAEYDGENSTQTEKIIVFGCRGKDDGIATYSITINLPDGASVETEESPFGKPLSNIKDGRYTAAAMSAMNVRCDNGVFLTLTLKLEKEPEEDFEIELSECKVADEAGKKVPYESGACTVLIKADKEKDVREATAEPAVTAEPEDTATTNPASRSGSRSGGGSSSGSSSVPASTVKPTSAPEKGLWIEPAGDESILIIVHYENGKLSSVEKKRYEGRDRIDASGFGLKQDDGIYLYDLATGKLSQKILREKE